MLGFFLLFACFQGLEDWRRRGLDFKAKEREGKREKKKTWVVFTVYGGWALGNSDTTLRWNEIGDKVVVGGGCVRTTGETYSTIQRSKAKNKPPPNQDVLTHVPTVR